MRVLDYSDLVELVAFVESVGGVGFARYIFHWNNAVVRYYRRRIVPYVGGDAAAAVRENQKAMDVDVGLAVLRALREGGWKFHRTLPVCVKMALKSLRKDGNTIAAISKATGLTREQVKTACDVRRGAKSARAAALSALAVG